MKKKLCIALSVLMIMMTLFVPMASWAEPDNEGESGGGQEVVEPAQPEKQEQPSQEQKQEQTVKKDSSSKKTQKSSQPKKAYNQNSGQEYDQEKKEVKPESKIEEGTISLILTGDIHSHLDSHKAKINGKTKTVGGFARMASVFKDISPDYMEDSFILDAGDFSMGTAYQSVFETSAAELRMLGYLGYDATTLGNHEFDYGPEGLANMLKAAKKLSKDEDYDLPKLCISNIDWDQALADKDGKDGAKILQDEMKDFGAEEGYIVLKKNDVKIAVFGIFGKNSEQVAPDSDLYFKDQAETAKKIVGDIKSKEKDVDLIVCISHCGISENKDESEDEAIAAAVPDIDLIVSGHSHLFTEKPIVAGNTVIAAPGCFGERAIHMTYKKDAKTKKYAMDEYKLIEVDGSYEEDSATQSELNSFKAELNSKYFSKFGYSADTVLARNKIKFTAYDDIGVKQGEEPLGNLLADSYVYTVEKVEGKKAHDVDVAIVPEGVIRSTFVKGSITAGDAFGILSLGKGEDGLAGYPLVSAYVTGKELKAIAEVDATVSDMREEARLYISGLSYKINPNRLKLNRAFDIMLGNGDDLEKIDNEKLYRVVTDMYTAKVLSSVTEESKGFLSIVPKNEDGSIILDFNKCIVKDGKKEVKAWLAAAEYLDHMGIVSSKYKDADGRKIISDTKNIRELVCQPNKMGWLVRLAVLIPLVIILLILLIIWIRRHRRRSNMMFSISERQKKAIFAPPKKQKNLFAGNDRNRRRNRRNGRF